MEKSYDCVPVLEVAQGVLRGTGLHYLISAPLTLPHPSAYHITPIPHPSHSPHYPHLPHTPHPLLLQNVVKMLVEAGADVDALDIFGTNALVGAVKAGHSECCSYC